MENIVDTGKALLVDFEVSEGIYSRACIEDTDSVCLWLGANVMLEYSCEEATDLLQKNLENARASLEVLVTDLQFLRDQVTITQFCCLSGERDCKFCVLMKKTLRYLAGVAGPSGYGSNSTAEQVTQQDCSFLLPSSQAQLTALVTDEKHCKTCHTTFELDFDLEERYTIHVATCRENGETHMFPNHKVLSSQLQAIKAAIHAIECVGALTMKVWCHWDIVERLKKYFDILGGPSTFIQDKILRNNNISGSIPSNIGDYQRLLQL
ncbi:unnamed protein product [Camellia sinensis]